MDAVLILSGGVDSTTLLYDLTAQGKTVHPISFNYGQKHSKELICAAETCDLLDFPLKVLDISGVNQILDNSSLTGLANIPEGHYADESMKSTVVPNRNMIMLSLAIGYGINIGSGDVYYGAHAGDHAIYPDCREEFVRGMQNVSQVCHYTPVHVHAPYLKLNKADIVRKGLMLGVDYKHTWTCYKGGARACGVCGSCVERLEAFEANGATDPIQYEL